MGRFAKGYLPDPDGHKVTSFRFAWKIAATSVPASMDLVPFAPLPLDQNFCGSCVGHATAGALTTSFAKAGQQLGFIPSPRSIYQLARCLDRSGPDEPLTDEGSMPNQAIRSLTEWGIRPMRGPTSGGYNSDCEPANVNDEPKLGELEDDAHAIVIGQYAIDSTGAQCIRDVCAALASGYAVTVASFVDTAFEELGPESAPYDVPDETDPNGGGHYIFLVGYRTNSAGKIEFHLQNSWGTGWGQGGRCWVTEDFVKQTSDRYAMKVKLAPKEAA